MRILLPTLDDPSSHGGVARYIDAIAKTFSNVRVVFVDIKHLTRFFWNAYHEYDELWVHHVLPIGTRAWMYRMCGGKPYVIFLHGLDFDLARRNVWKRWLTRRILRNAKNVVTNSHALANEVALFASIPDPLVVYPCVDDALVAAACTILPSHYPLIPLRLLTVGRLVERKGHLTVIEAIKDDDRFSYTIVGDGEMKEEIQQKIREYALEDRVQIHGNVDNVALANFYMNADVFVMPSHKSASDREGFGIVYLEAALFGLPVIAVRQPGVDEAVVDGETGVCIEDAVAVLQSTLRHMVTDPTRVGEMGLRGRERVLAEFTREKQFGRLRELL